MAARNATRNQRTPRLDIHSDDGLGGGLCLSLLLLAVLCQTLLAELGSIGILLLIVVAAEQVDIVVILLSSRGLGGVDCDLGDLGSVCCVGLGGVAGQGRELVLERGDVLVPARSVGILGGVGSRREGLEGGDIGLRGSVSDDV